MHFGHKPTIPARYLKTGNAHGLQCQQLAASTYTMFFSNLYVPPARAPEGSGREVEQLLDTPPIEILPMAQRSEARDSVEDWTGITSTAVRRKLQNRLNQRASSKLASIQTL